MDLQLATTSNIRLWNAARGMALACFALASLLLVASLQASSHSLAGASAKGIKVTHLNSI